MRAPMSTNLRLIKDDKHHFIHDLVDRKITSLKYIKVENKLADIFTKALDASR